MESRQSWLTHRRCFPTATTVPARRWLRWYLDGLRLWQRAPLKLFFVSLAVSIVELVVENKTEHVDHAAAGGPKGEATANCKVFGLLPDYTGRPVTESSK